MSSLNLFQNFVDLETYRQKIQLGDALTGMLSCCEYAIRIQFDKNDKNKYKGKGKVSVSKEFKQSFNTLNREQKINYYIRIMEFIKNIYKGISDPPKSPFSGIITAIGYSRSFNIKRWKEKTLRLDQDQHLMYAQREQKIKTYHLKDYLIRKSKNKDYISFVLEAINTNPYEKSRTVHIGFNDQKTFDQWFNSIKYSIEYCHWELVFKLMGKHIQSSQKNSKKMEDDFRIEAHKTMPEQSFNKSSIDFHTGYFQENEDELSKSMVVTSNIRKEVQYKKESFSPEPIRKGQASNLKLNTFDIIPNQLKNNSPTSKQDKRVVEEELKISKLELQLKALQEKKDYTIPNRKTIVDELIDGDVFEQPDVFEEKILEEKEEIKIEKKHLDLFHKIYPEYELQELEMYINFQTVFEQQNFRLYQNKVLEKRLKMVIQFNKIDFNRQKILSIISKPQSSSLINQNIQQMQLKTIIQSQNSALMYQVNKPFNRLYRSRDFVFIRHVFSNGNKLYMIDKSIQNSNYPPFMTIVRGSCCIVWGIFERLNGFELIADVQISNQGYLNIVQDTNINLKYLKGFSKVWQTSVQIGSYKLFDYDWDISKNDVNKIDTEIRTRRNTIKTIQRQLSQHEKQKIQQKQQQKNNKQIINSSPNFSKKNQIQQIQVEKDIISDKPKQNLSPQPLIKPVTHSPVHSEARQIKKFDKKSMETIGELNSEQVAMKEKLQTELQVIRKLDKNGLVIIDKSFLTYKYLLKPTESQKYIYLEAVGSPPHPIWKGEWIHDDKEGAIIFINQKKIEDQKGVLKFVISKIGKNLLSGQSILSISLPVDIFSAESNLQRFIYSMSYGPLVLQKLEKSNLIQKLKKTVIFGITNSALYLNMQKPFNPILGQTFQCWINGCPAYAQQISHHPPIGALMFKGRGYEVTAQLESKVSLAMNSGTGTNDGIYRVKFSDKQQICFITPGGEVSGLTYGDRKFNIVGKSYYWIENSNIVLQLVFDPFKKGFFSVGKQQEPCDYFEGTVYEVKPEFMLKFIGGKKKEPEEKDRLKNLGKFSGVWNKYIKFNNEQIFNMDKEYPLTIEYQVAPLPSDANWREDIEYRRLGQTTRAQSQKERLQVLQRKDRKLREKFNKKK